MANENASRATQENPGSRQERSFLEAGLFGWAVILAIAATVFLVGSLGMSALVGSFELDDMMIAGFVGLGWAGGLWLLSRAARSWVAGVRSGSHEP